MSDCRFLWHSIQSIHSVSSNFLHKKNTRVKIIAIHITSCSKNISKSCVKCHSEKWVLLQKFVLKERKKYKLGIVRLWSWMRGQSGFALSAYVMLKFFLNKSLELREFLTLFVCVCGWSLVYIRVHGAVASNWSSTFSILWLRLCGLLPSTSCWRENKVILIALFVRYLSETKSTLLAVLWDKIPNHDL